MYFLMVGAPALFFFTATTWIAYSTLQERLIQSKFTALQVLSELRHPDGQPLQIYNWTTKWRKSTTTYEKHQKKQWYLWKVGQHALETVEAKNRHGNDVVENQYLKIDRQSLALWGNQPIPERRMSLRQLCALRTIKRAHPCENLLTQWQIQEHCAEALPGLPQKHLSGDYYYAYRDYSNFEEVFGMLNRRYHYQMIKLRSRRVTLMEIIPSLHDTEYTTVRLSESFVRYGFIPLKIIWTGRIHVPQMKSLYEKLFGDKGTDNTKTMFILEHVKIRTGWKWCGRVQRNPEAIRKLYGQPWEVLTPKEDPVSGDIIIFYRKGFGKLVFCRPTVLG